ncbi:hypothetical protein G6F35_009323 [Rhizopus arrhizus]|nr:hypothetical protein G6F35_009323 [Rhizopus arrhizus]
MSCITTQNDLLETHKDISQETGQKRQLSTGRLWQTLDVSKWRQNKLLQADMKTQISSRLWAGQQLRFSRASMPLQSQETKKPSFRSWKKLDGCRSSALPQAKKLTEKRRSSLSQPSDCHNMHDTWKINMSKTKTKQWSSLPKMSKRSTKPDMNTQSFEMPLPIIQEVSPMEVVTGDVVYSEDEVLEVVSPKSLFLEEAEEGDFPTQPRCQTTTLTKTNSHQPTTAPTTNEVGSSLHYAGRWNTTGGEIATVLSTMEEDGESPVAIVCNRGGLSTSISSATFSLEDKTNETIVSRSRGSILSSGEILEGRNHRNLTNSKRGLFVQLLHNPRTNKEAPDSRLYPTEPIFAISTLQDGKGTSLETDHREGRFDVQTRPQRCICVQVDGIWTQCGAQGVYQDHALCFGTTPNARFSDQLGEECPPSKSNSRIPWLCIQYQEDVNFSSNSKITEVDGEAETGAEQPTSESFMQMDSKSARQDDGDDTGNWRSVATPKILTTGLGSVSTQKSPKLGGTLSIVQRKPNRIKLKENQILSSIATHRIWVGE